MQPRSIILAAAIGMLASGSCVSPSRAGDIPMPVSRPWSTFAPLVIRQRADGTASLRYRSGSPFAEITKGAGTDPSAISAEFYVAPTDSATAAAGFVMPAGAFDGSSGWRRNDSKRAEYRSSEVPVGSMFVAYSAIRPAKTLRLEAGRIDAFPFLFEDLQQFGAYTSYCVVNGGQRFCHCSTLQSCTLTTSGGLQRVECAAGISDERCNAVTRARPAFSATASSSFTDETPKILDDDFQDLIEYMNDQGYGVSRGSFELPTTPGFLPGQQFASERELGSIVGAPDPTSHTLQARFDETQSNMIRLGGQDLLAAELITDSSNAVWSLEVSIDGVVQTVGGPVLPRGASTGASDNLASAALDTSDQGERAFVLISGDQQSIDDFITGATMLGFQPLIDRALIVHIPDVQIPDGLGGTRTAFSISDEDVPQGLFAVRRRWSVRPGRFAQDRGSSAESRPFYLFRQNAVAPRIPVSIPSSFSPPHANLVEDTARDFDRLVDRVIRHFENEYSYELVSDQPLIAMNGIESGLGIPADIFEGGARCIADGLYCGLDDGTSYYAWPGDSLMMGGDDYYLVVGLKYGRLVGLGGPMATVSTLGIYYVQDPDDPTQYFTPFWEIGIVDDEAEEFDQGIFPVDNIIRERLPRRVRDLLPNTFMVQIGRPQLCLPPPLVGRCPDTNEIGLTEPIVIAGRLQLNPVTGTKPDPSQVVPWRLLHFVGQ